MAIISQPETKEQILSGFQKLLAEKKKNESKVYTKEEEAKKEKNQELIEVAANYTVDSIVNGMAALQLNFGSAIHDLSERLSTEVSKLDELKQAIAIENQHLENLQQIRLVADALHILNQEHQEKLQTLESQAALHKETIDKEKTQLRKSWEKEQAEFALSVTEEDELLVKQRTQEKADYDYEIDRLRKVELDRYEQAKREQERTLKEQNQEKEKDWQQREKYLTDHQAEFAENEKKIAGFEEELKKAYIKAKEEAIKEAEREAKVKTDLFEKEWESTQQGYDLKVASLEATIQRQNEQMNNLIAQLQEATKQAQELAMKAFQSSAKDA
jgi:hypothetical protein